jgi:MFS transporter, FLVCR family, MFS-domain-containing protein 7
MDPDENGAQSKEYVQYRKRWLILAIVFLQNFVLQIIFITFAPVATSAAHFFNVSTSAINWLVLVWLVLAVPCTFLSGWSFHKLGLRTSLLIAGAMVVVGTAVRILSLTVDVSSSLGGSQKDSTAAYSLVLVGTIVVASSQPIILASTTQVAAAWFSERQRGLANTLVRLPHSACLARFNNLQHLSM